MFFAQSIQLETILAILGLWQSVFVCMPEWTSMPLLMSILLVQLQGKLGVIRLQQQRVRDLSSIQNFAIQQLLGQPVMLAYHYLD